MKEVLAFFSENAPLGIIGLFFCVGFLYRRMVPKSICHVQTESIKTQLCNATKQREWMMDALQHLLTKNGVEGKLPAPPREDS